MRAQSTRLIVAAAIVLLVVVLLIYLFQGRAWIFARSTGSCELSGGSCQTTACAQQQMTLAGDCKEGEFCCGGPRAQGG